MNEFNSFYASLIEVIVFKAFHKLKNFAFDAEKLKISFMKHVLIKGPIEEGFSDMTQNMFF